MQNKLLNGFERAFPTRHGLSLHVSRYRWDCVGELQSCGYIGPELSALLCDQSPTCICEDNHVKSCLCIRVVY